MTEGTSSALPALRLIGVSRTYGRGAAGVTAVSDINLEVRPGELVGLVGPDGSGKTTLARLAAGVLAPSTGRVEPELGGRVGYLTGRYSLYPDLTAGENVRFFARTHGLGAAEAKAEARRLLEWLGLWPFRDRPSGTLSGGMRQKLALACALVHRPPVLVLDEPTTAVDPAARIGFWSLLAGQAREGRAVLVTTPYMDEAELCDRVGLLHRGRLVALGPPAVLKQEVPWQIGVLTPVRPTGAVPSCAAPGVSAPGGAAGRQAALRAAGTLPGLVWSQPRGGAVRVALEAGALWAAPDDFHLERAAAGLEDAYVWFAGTVGGVTE